MAETTHMTHDPPHPHPPPSSTSTDDNAYSMKDVIMWRKKRMSFGVMTTATVMFVVMQVYGFNFITVASYMAIFLVSSLFAWANIYKIIYKEEPSLSGLGISENTANGIANSAREFGEDATRWVFKIGSESEWYVFAATVVGLWLLSVVGRSLDLLTLLYVGTMVGMTLPIIWLKYDNKIREYGDRLQMQSMKLYSMTEKVIQNLKTKLKLNLPEKDVKDKKVE